VIQIGQVVIEGKDFVLELPVGWRSVDRKDGFEAVREDGAQILISSHSLGASEVPGVSLARFVELGQRAYLKADPSSVFEQVEQEAHADRLVASFAGKAPAHGFEFFRAAMISTRALLGRHVVVSFTFTGRERSAVEARAVFAGLRFMPQADAVQRAEKQADDPADPERVYPYVVTEDYLRGPSGASQPLRSVGHGLVLVLAEDVDGMCRVLNRESLSHVGLDPGRSLERAFENLERLLARQEIPMHLVRTDKGNLVRLGYHWLAASCIVSPRIRDSLRRNLSTENLVASVPHRDVLLALSGEDPTFVSFALSLIRANEADGRKKLTWELFRLSPAGPEPITPQRR
jgi:hypothetical protein